MSDIKFRASLDTTQAMSSIHEIRAQLGMAFASATGFNNAAMAMSGSPNLGGSGFGATHTNPAMAYSPHYGAVQAHTTMQQEWQVGRYGLQAAQGLKPPGVSAASYAMGAMSNAIDRDIQGRQQAQMAGREAFWTGAGGLAGGEVASIAAAPVGAFLGGRLGGRLFGGGGVGAGRMLGGLGAGLAAFGLAQDYVGGKISEHFAQVEQIGGVTGELGQLAGGGRGLSRLQQYNLGVSARQAAGDLKIDVQQMGDVLALGRQSGMLPTATEPGKAREQYREFARAIEEGAQVLQSSLAGATQVIKTATQQGMSAQEGVARAAGAGGADIWLQQQARMRAFGGAGAAVGMSMGFAPGQGRSMFTGALGAAGGLSGAETKIMGGRFGAAQFVGTTQMAMASSPTGDVQLMAAMSGRDMSGMGMMGMAGAAMDAMSEGGDMVGNMIRFQVHKNEYRRGIGAGGIRTMAREQIRMGGEMISSLSSTVSQADAEKMYAISMGLSPDQAKTLVGGGGGRGGRGGGGGGGRGGMSGSSQARAVIAMQNQQLSSLGITGPSADSLAAADDADRDSFGWGYAGEGAITGAMMGSGIFSAPGAAIGGAVGFVAGNVGAIGDLLGGGPPTFASAEEKADYYRREAASQFDTRMGAAKERLGHVDLNEDVTANFLSQNLGNARLSYDAAGSRGESLGSYSVGGVTASTRRVSAHERLGNATTGGLRAMGMKPVDAGPGTIEIGGQYWNTSEYQKRANSRLWTKEASKADQEKATLLAYDVAHGEGAARKFGEAEVRRRGGTNASQADMEMMFRYEKQSIGENWDEILNKGSMSDAAAQELAATTRKFIQMIPDEEQREAMMTRFTEQGGVANKMVNKFMAGVAGRDLKGLDVAFLATRAGGAAAQNALQTTASRKSAYMAGAYRGTGAGASRERTLDRYLDELYAGQSNEISGLLTTEGKEALARTTPSENISEAAERLGIKGNLFQGNFGEAELKEQIGQRTEGMNLDGWLSGKGFGAGLPAKGSQVNELFWRKFGEHEKSAEVSAAIVRGDTKTANRLFRETQKMVMVEGGATFEGYVPAEVDVSERVAAPGAQAVKRAMKDTESFLRDMPLVGGVLGDMAKTATKFVDKEMQKKVMEKFSYAEQEKAELAGTGKLAPKKRRRRRGTLQRAAGFGQRESAMATINRSLRHSEKMLKDTGRSMAKLANEIENLKST